MASAALGAWLAGTAVLADTPEACQSAYLGARAYGGAALYAPWNPQLVNASANLEAADTCVAARGGALDYSLRAELRRQTGDLTGAEADATRRVDLAGTSAAYHQRGLIRAAAGRHAEAAFDLRRASRDVDDSLAWRIRLDLVEALAELGDHAGASELAPDILATAFAEGAMNEAERISAVYRRIGAFDADVELWRQYESQLAETVQGDEGRARALFNAGRHEELIAAEFTYGGPSHDYRARSLRALGRHDEEIETLEAWFAWAQANAASYGAPPHGVFLPALRLCQALSARGEPGKALPHCRTATTWEGEAPPGGMAEALLAAGLAYRAVGRTEEADQHFRRTLEAADALESTLEQARVALAGDAAASQ